MVRIDSQHRGSVEENTMLHTVAGFLVVTAGAVMLFEHVVHRYVPAYLPYVTALFVVVWLFV